MRSLRTRQVTDLQSTTLGLLSAKEQTEYLTTGAITYSSIDDYVEETGKGEGNHWMTNDEKFFLIDLFDADTYSFEDGVFNIITVMRQPLRIEIFKENYLIRCRSEYKDTLAMMLLRHGEQIQYVGELSYISMSRKTKD
jgi:hypothetical protein